MQTIVGFFSVLLALVILLSPALVLHVWDRINVRSRLRTTQHRLVEALKEADIHRLASENASDGLLIQDMHGRVVWCNPAFCRIHGRSTEEMLGRNPREFALPPALTPPLEEIRKFRYDPRDPTHKELQLFENQHKKGHLFWNQMSVSFKTLPDGREYAIGVCRDVTEQINQNNNLREARERLEFEATHDGLTGILNRAAFLAFFENVLSGDEHGTVGLLHIDLDKFKAINDTHGHSAGDEVLTQTASSLRNAIRDIDIVARVGGDEFVVVCPDIKNLAALGRLADTLIKEMSEPFEWNGRVLQSQASIGGALSNNETSDADELLLQADFALYGAKRKGRNQVALYDDRMHATHVGEIKRSAELVEAVDTDALQYFFQPTMDLTSGAITGFETLVRWDHPTDGIVPPDQFLPLAQELGLMGALDLLSMTAALKQKSKLAEAGFTDIRLAFNASPELLRHPEFINRLTWGVEAGGIDRSDITIEVLETTEFGNAAEQASNAAIIHDLRSAGFHVHLDDFGIGFAGLSHLATLNVTGVKVDRSLVKEILTDDVSRKIVRKIVELSSDLGLCVVAEGVEDQDTATALHDMGCDIIQGYWLSPPMPKEDVLNWLIQRDQQTNTRSA